MCVSIFNWKCDLYTKDLNLTLPRSFLEDVGQQKSKTETDWWETLCVSL